MANLCNHDQALDIAVDILKHLVEQDNTTVLEDLREQLNITGEDVIEAYNVVKNIRELVDQQRY